MSVHNDERTVEKSINSILDQDYKNLELLIIDDGSNDETYKICKNYSNTHRNVKLYKNDYNIGLTKSLNILLNKSEGYFIARQDADDISSSSRLSKQLSFIEKYNLDACSTRAYVMNSHKITPSKSYYLPKGFVMKIKNPFIHGTLMAKKEVLFKIGQYDENFYYSQDYKLMQDLLDNGYKLKIIKEPLYYLNMKGNISVTHKEEQQYFAKCGKNVWPKRYIMIQIKRSLQKILRFINVFIFKKEIPTKVAIYFHDLKEKEVSDLKEILLFFTNRGYKFVNLNDLNKKLGSSEKLISITFDDGFASWSESLALFEKFNAQATFFINTIMFTNASKKTFLENINSNENIALINSEDIKNILSAGHEIGAHTHEHHIIWDENGRLC